MRRFARLALFAAGAGLCGLLALRSRQQLTSYLLHAVAVAEVMGPLGVVLYAVIFVLATFVFVPTASLEMIGGLLFAGHYGLPIACLIASGSKLAACSGQFILGRYLLRRRVEENIMPRFPVFRRAARLVSSKAVQTTVAIRCAPMPSIAKNLGLAVLDVPFITFALVSLCFNVPWACAAVLVGSSLTSLPEILDGRGKAKLAALVRPWRAYCFKKHPCLTALVLIGVSLGLFYMLRASKRAYAELLEEPDNDDETL